MLKIFFLLPGIPALFKTYFSVNDKRLVKNVFGIDFPNPVGLAAGFDKDATLFEELSCFGFGFIEIGTVTPKGQPGNPKPRLFRLPKDKALINRMGFNNKGAGCADKRLQKRKTKIIIGGNIGKNKLTPNEKAIDDYEKCFTILYEHVDYFVVNVSSPNTPGLRALQEKESLAVLLQRLCNLNKEQTSLRGKTKHKPVLLKIAPDLTNGQLDDIIEIVLRLKLDGIVATNTTVLREGLITPGKKVEAAGMGGLSGKPLKDRSTEIIRYIVEKSGGAFPVIGAGGIFSPEDALEKLNAGASLIQLYTGFIYEGPCVIKKINKAIIN